MNNYFNTFKNISQSVEQRLKDEHNSLEMKQSATSLKQSVQPCIPTIAFYNNGLQQQQRYQQQTPQQREAEKTWHQERQELVRMHDTIEVILNALLYISK